jgi:hypothetical protein
MHGCGHDSDAAADVGADGGVSDDVVGEREGKGAVGGATDGEELVGIAADGGGVFCTPICTPSDCPQTGLEPCAPEPDDSPH